MMDKKITMGHITALITIVIWGTTFISTKILLADFTPIEILFFRFLLGLLVLIAVYPKRLRIKDKKQEFTFAAAGLCGISLYYLLENIALTYTMASNVGVINFCRSVFYMPFYLMFFIMTEEKLKSQFFVGFVVAIIGICLISFNGKELELNPIGDILAIAAAFVWAVYSLVTRKISSYGYNTIGADKEVFTYGILFMLPFLFIFDFSPNFQKIIKPEYALNLIYLGLGASALCFVTWNYAVKVLGTVKTSVYIYIVPVITVITSVIVLKEEITWMAAIGIGLTLIGLFLSESKLKFKKRGKQNECRE